MGSYPKAVILMYHRIADAICDPWGLCVSPQKFTAQLGVLREVAQPMRLDDLRRTLQSGGRAAPAVAVTFDDGYADNRHTALPLLERYGVPATVFVATAYSGSRRTFWWDIPERIFLRPGMLPQMLRLQAGGISRVWDLGERTGYREDDMRRFAGWRAWEPPPTVRHATYYAVWQLLQPLNDQDRLGTLQTLQAWAGGSDAHDALQRPLTNNELDELAAAPLIDIGAHTMTHPLLSALSAGSQRQEIEGSKSELERRLNQPIMSFAYPYGGRNCYTDETKTIVREAGFQSACSTISAAATAESDAFELPRFQVGNWGRDEFRERLAGWLNGALSAGEL